MEKKITFTSNGIFFATLKERVLNSLGENKTGNYVLYLKTTIIVVLATFLYFLPYFTTLTVIAYLSIAALRGVLMGLAGFNIGHDAIHGSYTTSKKINKFMGYSFDVSGVSSYHWFIKHNVIHHTFTNTEEDTDIETNNFLRLAPWQEWKKIYAIQCIYAFLLYGLLHLQWVFYNDIQKYRKNMIGKRPIKPMSRQQARIFWIAKILYVIKSLLLPMVLIGFWQGLFSFLMMEFVCGLTISIVFQLAHVQNKSQFEGTSEEWAIHQLQTTSDFATRNPIISWLLGGLNFQAIHHLFPQISHVHYPKIQKVIIETCKEFQVEYKEYPSMWKAFCDHVSYLWKMGKKPVLQN